MPRAWSCGPRGVRLFGAAAERKGLSVQLAFGGAYYGIVDVAELGMRVVPEQVEQLTRAGAAITEALRRDHSPTHPIDESLGFVYGTILVDSDPGDLARRAGAARPPIRNVTVFADAEVDRSPCGSGTSALLAARHALGASRGRRHASSTRASPGRRSWPASRARPRWVTHDAVITSVEGNGYVTGHQRFVLDERDRLGGASCCAEQPRPTALRDAASQAPVTRAASSSSGMDMIRTLIGS